jgi:hypothetical protein
MHLAQSQIVVHRFTGTLCCNKKLDGAAGLLHGLLAQ